MEAKEDAMAALKREAVDLENIPVAEVFENLRCTKEGLSSEDAGRRLEIFGQNKLEEKNVRFPYLRSLSLLTLFVAILIRSSVILNICVFG